MMLCKLSDVKTMLGITDESSDAKLTMMIKAVSSQIQSYLGYRLAMSDYSEELHSVNNNQLLQLNAFPLRSVASVTANGVEIDDFKIIPEYARWGRLYRGNGWSGAVYTRSFTHDVVSGAWTIDVSYRAGYYLPNDTENYTEDGEESLPYDIVSTCMQLVIQRYQYDAMGAVGLKSHTEGHISDTFGDGANEIGLTESMRSALSPYVYYGVA